MITETLTTPEDRRRSTYGNRMVVYVEDVLTSMIDREYFNNYQVYNLPFKCTAWNSVCRAANQRIINKLAPMFPGGYTMKYSRKAGCSCGCSPGYVIKRHGDFRQPLLDNANVWVTVEFTDQEIAEFRATWDTKFAKQLAAEQLEHSV